MTTVPEGMLDTYTGPPEPVEDTARPEEVEAKLDFSAVQPVVPVYLEGEDGETEDR